MYSNTQRQPCLYHRNLFLAPSAVTASFGKEWDSTLMCVDEKSLNELQYEGSLNISSKSAHVPVNSGITTIGDHTYNRTTDTHMLSLKGDLEFITQNFPSAHTHTRTHFELRRKLLHQQSQCVRACVFTFEYEANSGYHWEDQSHPARTGKHETA